MKLKKINYSLVNPIKCDSLETEHKDYSILVGKNGTGKTLHMVITWFMTMGAAFVKQLEDTKAPFETILEKLTFLLEGSFDAANLEGSMNVETDFYTFKCKIENREAIDYILIRNEELEEPPVYSPATFLSTNTRTFEQIEGIMKTSQMIFPEENLFALTDEQTKKLLTVYKIYDLIHCIALYQKVITHHKGSITFSEKLKSTFTNFLETVYTEIYIDDDYQFWIKDEEGKVKRITTMSKGEQSIINMFLQTAL